MKIRANNMHLEEDKFADFVEELSYRIGCYSWKEFQRIGKENDDILISDMFGLMLTAHAIVLAQFLLKFEIDDAEYWSNLLKDTFIDFYNTEQKNKEK